MQLDSTILEDFKQITGKDISVYIATAYTFFAGDYNTIVNYYSGNTSTISSTPFANFDALKQRNKDVFEAFKEHSRQFNNMKWWLLIEQIEEIDNRLATLNKINKWSRSSLTKVGYDPSMQISYTLDQKESIENAAVKVNNSTNPNDDWVDIALTNRVAEEDYTTEGGTELSFKFNKNNTGFKISAVVDVITGKAVYGRDMNRVFEFVGNDIAVLSEDDTILQGADILATLRKKDNPDNPNNGIQSSVITGSNRAVFNFPVIVRQINQTFAQDDRFKNLSVNNINLDQDNFSFDYSVETRIDEVISNGQFI